MGNTWKEGGSADADRVEQCLLFHLIPPGPLRHLANELKGQAATVVARRRQLTVPRPAGNLSCPQPPRSVCGVVDCAIALTRREDGVILLGCACGPTLAWWAWS